MLILIRSVFQRRECNLPPLADRFVQDVDRQEQLLIRRHLVRHRADMLYLSPEVFTGKRFQLLYQFLTLAVGDML